MKTEFGHKGRVESSRLPRRMLFQIAGTLCTKLRGNKKYIQWVKMSPVDPSCSRGGVLCGVT